MLYFRGADRCASTLRGIVRKEQERERLKCKSSGNIKHNQSDGSESESGSETQSESASAVESDSNEDSPSHEDSGTQRDESDPQSSSLHGSLSQTQTSVSTPTPEALQLIHTQLAEDDGTLVDISSDRDGDDSSKHSVISNTQLSGLLPFASPNDMYSPLFSQYR